MIEQLDPSLYSVNVAKSGFVLSYASSVRVITRKNIKIEFELREQAIKEVLVLGEQAETIASINGTYLDREALANAVDGGSDPLLSLDGLPGLAATGEFTNFSVRGRGPRDNLLFVDDFPFDKAVHFDASLGDDCRPSGRGFLRGRIFAFTF